MQKECKKHGIVKHHRVSDGRDRYRHRCGKCMAEAVSRRRRKVKQILVEEAGGCCSRCGYGKSMRALSFHHVDPGQKLYALGLGGNRSLDRMRKEASKCILLCANCHAEVEDEILAA